MDGRPRPQADPTPMQPMARNDAAPPPAGPAARPLAADRPVAHGDALPPWVWLAFAGALLSALAILLLIPDLLDDASGRQATRMLMILAGSILAGVGLMLTGILGRMGPGSRAAFVIAGAYFLLQGGSGLGMLGIFGGLFGGP